MYLSKTGQQRGVISCVPSKFVVPGPEIRVVSCVVCIPILTELVRYNTCTLSFVKSAVAARFEFRRSTEGCLSIKASLSI
jgi:hypothetical protein